MNNPQSTVGGLEPLLSRMSSIETSSNPTLISKQAIPANLPPLVRVTSATLAICLFGECVFGWEHQQPHVEPTNHVVIAIVAQPVTGTITGGLSTYPMPPTGAVN